MEYSVRSPSNCGKIMNDERFMRIAIEKAREGIIKGQAPFGACIVNNGKVIVSSHNLVWQNSDITAHAEIVAIRAVCQSFNMIDLSGATIYSTTEPCPMCFCAIHWARISRIVFGTSIEDAKRAGFNELSISNADLKNMGGSTVEIVGNLLRDECAALFKLWNQGGKNRVY